MVVDPEELIPGPRQSLESCNLLSANGKTPDRKPATLVANASPPTTWELSLHIATDGC